MYVFEELKDMIEKELKTIVKRDGITPQDLEAVGEAVDILKDIETIMAMRGGRSYSYDSDMNMSNRSYNSMRGSYNYSGEPSYARGHGSYDRYSNMDAAYEGRGYSRHTETERMIDKLETMSDMTDDPKVKRAIDQCIAKLES